MSKLNSLSSVTQSLADLLLKNSIIIIFNVNQLCCLVFLWKILTHLFQD